VSARLVCELTPENVREREMADSSGRPEPVTAEMLAVNGTHIYYEVYGEGPPLLFLYGYSLSSRSWKRYLNAFGDYRA
jgi:hypothetical protein